MRRNVSRTLCAILTSTALAHAAWADQPQAVKPGKAKAAAASSKPATQPADAPPQQEESVAVTARRNIPHNAENLVTKTTIEQQVAGTNILKSLAQVPGVSFSSTDALGLDTWGANVYMRGYFMDQLGMSLDGIPLNDQTYAALNGVNINNAAISDDIERVNVSQGAGAVDIPSNTNLGGTMQFFTGDPKNTFGGKISQGFGSYGMKHTYVRIDSGELNPTGTKFFVSYARNYEQKYDSPSPAFMQQVDGKLVQPLGPNSRMSAFFNWSDAEVWGYADKSLDILNDLGWRTESFYPNYAGAYAAANWIQYCDGTTPSCATPAGVRGKAQIPAGWINTNEQGGVAFYDAGQQTTNYVGGLNFDVALTDRLRWTSTIYGHSQTEYDTYGDPYQPSATGAPLSEQVWQPRQERYGFQTALEYHIADHTIHSGVWYENNNQAYSQYWYNEPLLGAGAPLKTVGPYTTYGPAFMQNYGFQWNTNTFQYHFMDTWRPLHDVSINYGFKSMLQTTSGGANYSNQEFNYGPLPNGSMTSSAAFLPHVNLDWRFLPQNEIYFDFAENMRPYSIAGTGGAGGVASPWAVSVPAGAPDGSLTSQQIFQQLQKTLKPETDFTYLLGYRYSSRLAVISLDGYRSDDHHRLISASVGNLNDPISSVVDTQNAGMWGADATATITPYPGLSIYNSFSYNHFTYGAHVNACPTVPGGCDIYGKKMDGYPSFMYKTNLSYTWHRFTVHFDANYYSSRPFSLMNDTSVPGYWLSNSGARYRFGNYSVFKNVTVDFNVYNLFNSKYIAMMGENGFPVTGDYQSMERGSVREFFGNINTEF
jgi:iron complex outermembrane recepter protein